MGAGAGYSIKSTVALDSVQSLKLDKILEAYITDEDYVNFTAIFDCIIECSIEDLEFESYSYGGKIEDTVYGTVTKIRLQFENAEIGSESQSDIAEWIERNQHKIRENLRYSKIDTNYLVGAGWIHQTFTGAITDLDDLDAIEHEYYYANDWSLFIEAAKIVVESNVAEYIDKAVTGKTVTTIFYVEDEDFTELEAAKEYAIDNGYDKVMAFVDEEDFEGNFNTIDSYVAWRDEPVEDEFDDSLDESLNESIAKSNINEATTDEFKEIMSLAKQAGFKTAGELFKFKKEHEGEDLIKALRDRVGSNKQEAKAKMVITVRSGVNSDGFIVTITDKDGKEVFKQRYDYGYNASYKRSFADDKAPFVADIISELCAKYNISKNDIDYKSGENVFKGSNVSDKDVNNFKAMLDESLNEAEEKLVNGYKVFKAKSNGRWFVSDGSGYKCGAKGYETKEEAIERAKSLKQGKATSLEENTKEPIKEDSANGSVYGALYDTIQDAYDPVTYDEAEYAIETAYEDGDIDEEEYNELMQELNETRDNADKFDNEKLDELGKKFGLDYMFYKDRGEDVMLYAPDREDYEDEDAYEEKLEAFDDFLHYIEIDLDGDTEYFSETVTILHRW